MNDQESRPPGEGEASESGEPKSGPPRPARLPSARERAPSRGKRRRRGGSGGRRGRGSRRPDERTRAEGGKPVPARSWEEAAGPEVALDPDVDEVPVEAHGDTWVVRVLGRAQGGHGGARTPLLLLGFWPDDSTEGPPIREALVVGSLLSAQDQSRLTEALEHSVPHRNRGSESAFFEEAHERRGR